MVQALSAIATTFLTVALISVTWWYVRLTKTIAETMKRQLAAGAQPVVALDLVQSGTRFTLGRPVQVSGALSITNRGQQPIKICSVTVLVRFKNPAQHYSQVPYAITQRDNRVLIPGDPPQIQRFVLFTGAEAEGFDDCSLACGIDCTDLAGISEHSFFFDREGGLRHYFGFRKPVSRFLRMRLRLSKVVASLSGLKRHADPRVEFEKLGDNPTEPRKKPD